MNIFTRNVRIFLLLLTFAFVREWAQHVDSTGRLLMAVLRLNANARSVSVLPVQCCGKFCDSVPREGGHFSCAQHRMNVMNDFIRKITACFFLSLFLSFSLYFFVCCCSRCCCCFSFLFHRWAVSFYLPIWHWWLVRIVTLFPIIVFLFYCLIMIYLIQEEFVVVSTILWTRISVNRAINSSFVD